MHGIILGSHRQTETLGYRTSANTHAQTPQWLVAHQGVEGNQLLRMRLLLTQEGKQTSLVEHCDAKLIGFGKLGTCLLASHDKIRLL